MKNWLKAWWFIIVSAVLLCGSGIIPAIIPQAVPIAYKQGTGTKFQTAGTNSNTPGNVLCNDANGAATDSACSGAAATVPFSGILTGTNGAALHMGTGGTLDATGSGTIAATTFTGSLTGDVTSTGMATTLGANFRVRSFGGSFDGGGAALTAGKTTYVTVPFACTISAWNILVDTGTATVDIWRVATGTAIPTVAGTITAAAVPAISAGTAIHSTTLTGWCGTGTCLIAANDIIGVNLKVVASATYLNMVVECGQ